MTDFEINYQGPSSIDLLYKLKMPHSHINESANGEIDQAQSQEFLQILEQEYNFSDKQDRIQLKENLVEELRQLTKDWIKTIAKREQNIEDYQGGDLLIFGSQQLIASSQESDMDYQEAYFGYIYLPDNLKLEEINQLVKNIFYLVGQGISLRQKTINGRDLECNLRIYNILQKFTSHIDSICIVPKFVEREKHFFGEFFQILYSYPGVKQILKIQEAIVPLIRLNFLGIMFDVLFSKIDSIQLDENLDLLSNNVLNNMDEASCRSLNGYRVAKYLQKNLNNYENFRLTLKLVKLWAKNRGIYSNIIGYLSGIGWTILVAKICQLYPNYSPNKLLERFFFIYSRWQWQEIPIIIEEIKHQTEFPKLSSDQWWHDQKEKNLMMIITPCFPCMNCAFNVSPSTLNIIKTQFQVAYKKIQSIQNRQKPSSYLFEKFNFFKQYRHFLEISILAQNEADFLVYRGHIEAKIRKLTRMLEDPIKFQQYIQIHPYPSPLERKTEEYEFCSSYYYGLKCTMTEQNVDGLDLRKTVLQFIEQLEHSQFPSTVNVSVVHQLRSQLDKNILKEMEDISNNSWKKKLETQTDHSGKQVEKDSNDDGLDSIITSIQNDILSDEQKQKENIE